MEARIYILECLTNLHVGSGETNFNIVDNEVERDVLTKNPIINSSSVKGALREYFERVIGDKNDPSIIRIFGGEGKNTSPGQLRFLSAELLALATRGTGDKVFELITPELSLNELNRKAEIFLGQKIGIESILPDYRTAETLDAYPLPVLTRNVLDDTGISKNLWYEEVVPHKSLFFLPVFTETEGILKEFEKHFQKGTLVQFGANASIGYGLCLVNEVFGGA